nr:MAG TPA: hypothetical protein [Caudoviricetes sp.]
MLLCVGGSWQDYRSLNAHLLVVTNVVDCYTLGISIGFCP